MPEPGTPPRARFGPKCSRRAAASAAVRPHCEVGIQGGSDLGDVAAPRFDGRPGGCDCVGVHAPRPLSSASSLARRHEPVMQYSTLVKLIRRALAALGSRRGDRQCVAACVAAVEHRRSTAVGSRSTSNSDELGRRRRGRGRRRAGAPQPRRQPSASFPATSPPRSSCSPAPGPHAAAAAELLARGAHVVSTSGAPDDVRELLDLDAVATRVRSDTGRRGGSVAGSVRAAGPARSPAGWRHATSCTSPCTGRPGRPVPASTTGRWPGGRSAGTTGSGSNAQRAAAGSCAGSPSRSAPATATAATSPTHCCCTAAFPTVERISARRSATRRDRLTARLPMLSPPHLEGGIGAVRVEARGSDDGGGAGHARRRRRRADRHGGGGDGRGDGRRCSPRAPRPGGVMTTSDPDLPAATVLRNVLRHGVRLQEFTGIPQPGEASSDLAA